jgi:hypothetical protein
MKNLPCLPDLAAGRLRQLLLLGLAIRAGGMVLGKSKKQRRGAPYAEPGNMVLLCQGTGDMGSWGVVAFRSPYSRNPRTYTGRARSAAQPRYVCN